MVTTHNLGFPRIGAQRELKFAQESYWKGQSTLADLKKVGADLRAKHWRDQAALDWAPVGDFAFYDQMLDMSFTLGNLPERAQGFAGDALDNYFRVARGRSAHTAEKDEIAAGEMTKWFNTNYHYIVPEFTAHTHFKLDASRLLNQLKEAEKQGVKAKPVVIGPMTYLALGKAKDDSDKLLLLDRLLPAYVQLLNALADAGATWVQIDEPILVTELADAWRESFKRAYTALKPCRVKLLLTTYFGEIDGNRELVANLPVAGVHVDTINGSADVSFFVHHLAAPKVLSLGVVDGRNIWRADLNALLERLEPIAKELGDRLWIAPSCSLLHVPVDLASETKMDTDVKSWLAFALQKIEELHVLATALNKGRATVAAELAANKKAWDARKTSTRVNNKAVQAAVAALTPAMGNRKSPFAARAAKQAAILHLPLYPTTTIGSYPQTKEIRHARREFKAGRMDRATYEKTMRAEIEHCVREQEKLGLDVLVHGEAERNDMVEYFGEQLAGYTFSQFGWVQSYGSRCVKPPIIFGDISRPHEMTVEWITYAQSLTKKPMKAMLTGPVTMLNWSFVRDDQPRSITCMQLALAIRAEVLDLEKAGIRIIQIDEPAMREGLPLRKSQWKAYLDWAVECFRVTANGVKDETQVHTHMCYSEFNDIIPAIAALDADAITMETSRSDMELLDAFDHFKYPNGIGPGVYDIHSPNIPTEEHMVHLMREAAKRIPAARLWVNPDCGLKTRQWSEVMPALTAMVAAAHELRTEA